VSDAEKVKVLENALREISGLWCYDFHHSRCGCLDKAKELADKALKEVRSD
jgi:hypothetical protein